VIAAVVTIVLRQVRVFNGTDETTGSDYYRAESPPRLRPVASG
jgi:SSS family solute:Na+ symporter